jgi:hypothetical protein
MAPLIAFKSKYTWSPLPAWMNPNVSFARNDFIVP